MTGRLRLVAQGDAAEAAGPRPGPVLEAARRRVLHVGADAEGALAGARQHHHANVRALLEIGPDALQLGFGREVDRVEHLGPVDRQRRDVVANLVAHAHGRPFAIAGRRFGQDLFGVLAQARRHPVERHRRGRHLDRAGDEAVARAAGGRALHHHRVVHGLRIDQHFAHVAHRGAQQVLGLESRQPVIARPGAEALAEHSLQLGLVRELLLEVGEARLEREVGQLERGADVAQRIGLERADEDERVVGALEHARERHRRPVHFLVAHQDHRRFLHLHRQHRVVERDADLLALAAALALQQREQDALHHVHAGGVVGQRGGVGGHRMRRIGLPRHHAAHRLRQHVLAALVGVRAGLAEAGADGVDDAWVERAAGVVAEAHAVHHAGAEVVDDDIGAGDQRLHRRHALGVAQVEGDAALVAVEAAEDRVVDPLRRREGRAAQVAGAGALDLDHVGAVVAEHLGADRAHHDLGEVDDADAGERQLAVATGGRAFMPPPAGAGARSPARRRWARTGRPGRRLARAAWPAAP